MPRRDDLSTILIIGSGPIVIGQGCEFDYSGTQACKALKEEGYRVILVNSNPATIMTDPQFADRTYIEPITPEAVTRIIERHNASEPGRVGPDSDGLDSDGPQTDGSTRAGSRETLRIDAVLPTLGGQTALNCACALFDAGVFDKYGIEMIGADRAAIYRAEDRGEFKDIIHSLGLKMPDAAIARTMDEAWKVLEMTGLPAIIRPAFTLGGAGGGVAYNREEFEDIARRGLDASMNTQILIDRSLIGWKEYELEVMRDRDDNVVIVCSIENIDPMGVHTGDSITLAPQQTLTDREYQRMRDAAMAIIRKVGVETGGSNIQFAVNPADGEMVVIEMNPRVSRSSALASKATGFPIAKIAAKLAVGYTLAELPNDITGKTVACFEPTIDYVVTKIPRWTFEKFPEADERLTTQMKSVGEAMAIGRTFKESLQKGIRSMEVKRFGLGLGADDAWLNAQRGGPSFEEAVPDEKLLRKLTVPSQGRMYYLRYAFKRGWSVARVHEATRIDPWFLEQIREIVAFEDELLSLERLEDVDAELMFRAKQMGFSDPQLANLYLGEITTESILKVRAYRKSLGVEPVFKLVDTCAAEFEAVTPYYYSTYEALVENLGVSASVGMSAEADTPGTGALGVDVADDEIRITDTPKVIILGGGPNRIGQGIEFDYCCVQAAFAAQELGYEAVLINSNPETVSTDYDTSDLLFFEPLTLEDVLNVCERLGGGSDGGEEDTGDDRATSASTSSLLHGVIVQLGGQTPLNLAHGLEAAGVPIIGTSVDSIDLAEDRERFADLCRELDIRQPANGIARSIDDAVRIANDIGYPVLVRPSFVLGGRAMETVFDDDQLRHYMAIAIGASDLAGQPILIDKFLAEATECDVDVVADYGRGRGAEGPRGQGTESSGSRPPAPRGIVCGVMEHIEEAGIHSGDSACTLPPYSLPSRVVQEIKEKSRALAEALGVRGLMNVQWAVRGESGRGQGDKGTRGQEEDAEQTPSSPSAPVPLDSSGPSSSLYIIEVNPRASRTVPFVSKATGVSWAKIAAKVMMGESLDSLGVEGEVVPEHVSVKESVFPFGRFPGVDVILGPEMRSTGEVMGIGEDFAMAFAKSQMAAGAALPLEGQVFLSVREADKPGLVEVARRLVGMGFTLRATPGTRAYLASHEVESQEVYKLASGRRPNAADLIKNHELDLMINTPTKKGIGTDEGKLRALAVRFGIPMITTVTAAAAAVRGIAALREGRWGVKALQEYHAEQPSAVH